MLERLNPWNKIQNTWRNNVESSIHSPNISVFIHVFCCCVLIGKSGVMLQSKFSSRSKAWGPHAHSAIPSSHHTVSQTPHSGIPPLHPGVPCSRLLPGVLTLERVGLKLQRDQGLLVHSVSYPLEGGPWCPYTHQRAQGQILSQSYGPPNLHPSYQHPPPQALPHP